LTSGRRLMRRPIAGTALCRRAVGSSFPDDPAIYIHRLEFLRELFQPVSDALWPPRIWPFDEVAPVEMTEGAARGLYGVSAAPGGTSLYTGSGRVTYYIDRQSGRIVWLDQPVLDGTGQLVLRSLCPLDSRQIAGLPTRLLVPAAAYCETGRNSSTECLPAAMNRLRPLVAGLRLAIVGDLVEARETFIGNRNNSR